MVIVTEAPGDTDLFGGVRWEDIQFPYGRAGISAAHAQRCRDHRVFVGNGRAAKRLRDDA